MGSGDEEGLVKSIKGVGERYFEQGPPRACPHRIPLPGHRTMAEIKVIEDNHRARWRKYYAKNRRKP